MPDPHQHQPPGPGYGRLPPAADTKAQALPGVYIVHAAPLFPVQLHGETVASKKAGPDYKWSSRMSPPGPRSKDPDNKLPSWSRRLSARVSAAEERSIPQSVPVEVKASMSARLRGRQTSLVDSRLSSGTSGPGPGHGHGHGLLGIRNGAQRPGYDESLGEEIFRNMHKTLMPMMVILVLYGAIPVQFKPPRISVHPLRSTLLYVVVMQTCIVLSAHHVISLYSSLLHAQPEDARGVDERLLAILSVVHVSATLIIVVFWIEMPRGRACCFDFSYFTNNYGHMVGAQPFRLWTRVMPWFSVVFAFVGAPLMIYVWMVYILKAPLLANTPSHLFVVCNIFTILTFFAEVCNMIRDFASAVAYALKEELDAGRMTASRLEEFRLAWLSLRQLTTDLGSVPMTGLSLLLYLLIMNTLAAYQFAVSYYNNYAVLFFGSCSALFLLQSSLIYISDVAHRLQDAMSTGFYEPLESKSWRNFPADLLAEIMAAIATYLIVLFQLRMGDEYPATTSLPLSNATDSSLDSHQQFLHTMSTNPAVVTFGGVVNISRSTYLNELDAGCMTASRLEEFRLAWISLRQLTVDLGTMPLTGLAMLLLLLVMTTLCAYQFAVSYYNNYTVLFFSSSAILALLQFGLTYTTDVAHRVKEAHQQFLHTISMSPAEISYAGIVTITRSTYLSIMAAIATYLIVLFQLRMADEDPPTTPLPSLNATYSSLDSVFRSRN
ncbi:Gustatory and odorant receptor 24 [Frankliniella fusca]|uniref:Gustatory and odorant receptor 24 n=1 Tax=Frankliniella fusca TaxID=407009 RepID=A0AAE1LKH7_9NEOP|nr:Gustatory and odorant receptor 24 [Frankliniella fusca]